MKTRSGFQQSSLYERLFAWRFLIGIALFLLAAAVVWLVARPGISAVSTAVPSPPLAEITATTAPSTDTPSVPPTPSFTSTQVSAPATSQATPTEVSSPKPAQTETLTLTTAQATTTLAATSTPTAPPTPVATPSPTPTAVSTAAPIAQVYKVVRGDSLWKIAIQFYGDGQRWRDIYDANRDIIADPRLLRTGWELRIP